MRPEILSHFKEISVSSVSSLPDSPGVYAWYAIPQIGTADWRKDESSGTDTGPDTFRNIVANHSDRFSPRELKINSSLAFRDGWTGNLKANRYDEHVSLLRAAKFEQQASNSATFPARQLKSVIDNENSRGRLARLLVEFSTPIISSPIYIGTTKNLRDRVGHHYEMLFKWHEWVSKYPEKINDFQAKVLKRTNTSTAPDVTNEFAARAIASGFEPEGLRVYVLDIAAAMGINCASAEDLAAVLEWLMNTWNRPLLGRA